MSIETIAPNSRGKPKSSVIKEYWDAAKKPSQRSIEAKMRADGWEISHTTIMRCVRSGFGPRRSLGRPSKPVKTSPEINAVNQVNAIAGDAPAETVAGALLEAFKKMDPATKERVKTLVGMDDQELDRQANKLVKVARYLLAEDLAQNTATMMLMPDKAAKLYAALGTGLVTMLPPDLPETSHQMIEHNPNEPRLLSPSAQAIADFRAKRASVAA